MIRYSFLECLIAEETNPSLGRFTCICTLQLCLLLFFWVQQPLLGQDRPQDHPGGGLLPRPPPMQFQPPGVRPLMQNDMGPPGGIPSLLGPPPPMPFRMMPPGGE